jgi:hypothetical protein
LLEKAKLQGLAFLESLSERPTSVNQTVVLNSKLNETGIGPKASLRLIIQKFEKLMVRLAGPRFLRFCYRWRHSGSYFRRLADDNLLLKHTNDQRAGGYFGYY